jgi:hypothetical protein
MSDKAIKTRCPKGTRKNRKTGICEKIEKEESLVDTVTLAEQPGEELVLAEEPVTELVEVPVTEPAMTDATAAKQNEQKNKLELKERAEFASAAGPSPSAAGPIPSAAVSLPYLYPNLNDPNFNVNLATRKEFYDTQYDGEIKDVITESEIMCNADFELAPHQLFVRNFLSFQTPYNSLLLYHGLGSGKTCSAISIAEEMRDYLIQMNIANRIIIVASPNVQENFRLQLFDERKLQLIDGMWNIRSCTGNKFLKEINPMNMKGLTKETIVAQVKRIINTYYVFLGYTEFANYIQKKSGVGEDVVDSKKRSTIIRNKLKQHFSNRLIIIDEVHNIRITDDNPDKKRVAQELFKLVTYADNLRLLLLSATPMYNSYKEVIWLVNLMNLNDRRSTIEIKDVFNTDGSFKRSKTGEPIGEDLLIRKATGYISYVRGENPYTFPYKIWPAEFAPEHTFAAQPVPEVQLNGKQLVQHIEFLSLYLVEVGPYQQRGYDYIIDRLKQGKTKGQAFENLEAFGYTMLQKPIEALNMIYPDDRLVSDAVQTATATSTATATPAPAPLIDTMDIVGSGGLKRHMTFTESVSPPGRYDFEYKTSKWGRIFAPGEVGKYSGKIKTICDRIMQSTGVILIYSQYIDGGILPIAIALEELGFTRAGTVRSLFKVAPTEKIDALTFKTKKNNTGQEKKSKFQPAKYVMITGDKGLSPDNVKDINMATDVTNKNGEQVKVVLISLAGSEGLDLKFIRQVHILDPWYNMNRIEQIIGRAIRTCSHKELPFAKRNVEVYLYGSLLADKREEAVDLYVYRLAELKAVQIGNVSRVIKEIAVDCILNYQQANFMVDKMQQTVTLELASGGTLEYAVGDKPYSMTCDYMKKCSYTCKPDVKISDASVNDADLDLNNATYGESFIMMNNDKIIYKIKQLMKERFFYRKPLLVAMLNAVKTYPEVQINAALNQLVEERNEYISDKYGRLGNLVNIGDLYLFQPLELNNTRISLLERSMPVEFKHEVISIDLAKTLGTEPSASGTATASASGTAIATAIASGTAKATASASGTAIASGTDANEQEVKEEETSLRQTDAFTQLVERLHKNYLLASVPNKPKRGEENWYKFCSEVIQEMETLGLSRTLLLEALLGHLCDDLLYEEKLLLLNGFSQEEREKRDDFSEQLRRYLMKNAVYNKGLTGVFLQHKNEAQLFVTAGTSVSVSASTSASASVSASTSVSASASTSASTSTSATWTLAEAADKDDLEKAIAALKNQFLPAKTKLNSVVGFMANFKKEENNIVFKLKVFELNGIKKKRNKGARCYGKSTEMLTEILGLEMYKAYLTLIQTKYKDIIEEKKKNRILHNVEESAEPDVLEAINHTHACVIQEMFLRTYNLQRKGDRIWFVTPEEALLIDIENLSY